MNEDFGTEDWVATLDDPVDHDTPNQTLVPEKHLDSPITTSLLERLQSLMNLVYQDNKNIKRVQYDVHRPHAVERWMRQNNTLCYSGIKNALRQYASALDFCKLEPKILSAEDYPLLYKCSHLTPYRLQTDYKYAKRVFDHELNAYLRLYQQILPTHKINKIRAALTPPDVLDSEVVITACRAQLWSDVVEQYRTNYKRNRTSKKRTMGPIRYVTGDGFILLKHDDLPEWRLATYEQLQMIQDCCLARHNVELALSFSFHNGSPELRGHVHAVLKWQEMCLSTLGNKGFELVKAPEAVFKAHLNSLTGGDLLEYTSYQRTIDKMKEKEKKMHSKTWLIESFDCLTRSVNNVHDAAELFGLSKLSGHPTVYAELSAASVREEAQPVGTISARAVRNMERMFKHLTLSGYLNMHSAWPPLKCPPQRGSTLRRFMINNVTTLSLGSYPIWELDMIEFGKFVNYDYSEDYLKFLDDKAICPGAKELSSFWFGGNRSESRRLLQKILEIPKFDTVQMIERLRRGKFTQNERVVELTQKERELKRAARCFCKLPIYVRTFFTSTEYNLKEQFMKKYMPQQTMTMSSTETKQRMYNLVKDAPRKSRLLLEVDFSRWNLRWRETTVNGIAHILEDIFGLPGVFSQAHPFFSSATIVLTDKHSLPTGADPNKPVTEWPTSDLVWHKSHLGGFEGIIQGLWSICTISMMYWVMHDQNLSFNMAGQGDNQIFAITFDTSKDTMANQLRKLLAVMEVRCKLLNHEVKPDECIDSQTVLTYSKDIYVEGNHILYNLKFASRTFKREEIDIPSLSTEVASISACSMACADSVYMTPRAIFWRSFHTLRLFSARYRSPVYKAEHYKLHRMLSSEERARFSLLLPGSLGGLPVMAWTRFFLKGEVDDLSWDVPAVRALSETVPELGHDLQLLASGEYSPRNPRLEQLILDPHSIPIERPKDLKRLVKDAVAEKLPSLTRNEWIREIVSEVGQSTGKTFLEQLATTRPFYPQIMSDIYALSPSGVSDALMSRFTMTRTINSITGNPNFSFEITNANTRLIDFIMRRYERAAVKKGRAALPESSYETCKRLRSLWGDDVHHSNIGVYNPLDFQLRLFDSRLPMISASSRSQDRLETTLGPYPPNFGTKTRQKVSDHGFKITTSSSTIADLKKIVMTYSELGSDGNLARLLNNIVTSRSPWSITPLSTVLPTSYGGTAAHRHAALNASAFSILGSRTVPTHLNFCSDLAGKLSGGEFDYPIAFQEFYLTLTNIFQVATYCGGLDPNAAIGFRLTDDYEALDPTPVSCPDPHSLSWPIHQDNKLCYATYLQVDEIPEAPSATQVRHTDLAGYRPDCIVYNRLLAKYSNKKRLILSTASVNMPIELLDMKEFNHCPISHLIRGITFFIQAMAVFSVSNEYTRDASQFLKSAIMKLANACSGILSRLLIHPDFRDTLFANEIGAVCEPGQSGARAAADRVAGYLYNTTVQSMRAREFIHVNPRHILFADYQLSARSSSEIHATLLLALQSFREDTILLTSQQRLLLRTCRIANLQSNSVLICALQFRSLVNMHVNATRHVRGPGLTARYDLVYTNKTADEAIRVLRSLPRELRPRVQSSTCLPLKFATRLEVELSVSTESGSLQPLHECTYQSDSDRRLDHFLSLVKRPVSSPSSALSVWLTIFQRIRTHIVNKNVLSIGVGHGAVLTSAAMHGSRCIIGLDLRSSFPIATQREATYIPPLVVQYGFVERFCWSEHISRFGGDALVSSSDIDEIYTADVIVIDIEKDYRSLKPLLLAIPFGKTVVLRIQCCEEWMRFYVDAMAVDKVWNTTELRDTHTQSYILAVFNYAGFNEYANINRVTIKSVPTFSSSLVKDMKYVVQAFNHWLGPVGEEIKIISADEIKKVSKSLKRRAQMTDEKDLRVKLGLSAAICNNIATIFRDPSLVTDTWLSEAEKNEIRLVACWFANTGFTFEQLFKQMGL